MLLYAIFILFYIDAITPHTGCHNVYRAVIQGGFNVRVAESQTIRVITIHIHV